MKDRPSFKIHSFEFDNPATAIIRLHKHIRSLKNERYAPKSRYASNIALNKAMRPKLRLVK